MRITAVLLLLPAVSASIETAEDLFVKQPRRLATLDELFREKEERALALANLVSNEYEKRCGSSLGGCAASSYDNCVTAFPAQTCPADAIKIPACAGCGENSEDAGAAFFDYTVSTVRLPAAVSTGDDNAPATDEAAEAICYTRKLDDFFVSKNSEDVASEVYGGMTPQMYFGSSSGAFRIYPARHSSTCGGYDPRIRPWYVAASSGPKDVVLVLDVSGSMANSGRAALMVDAAKAVIKTLTISDWFQVVLFSSNAQILGASDEKSTTRLIQATKENKDRAIEDLDGVSIGGGTNFQAGFSKAFDIIQTSVPQEFTAGCHRAILFLTDGQCTDGLCDVDTISSGNPGATIFAYSLGSGADAALPKAIACANDGVWAEIADGGDLVGSMSSYYQLFARGLGDAENAGFTAWVEPYTFATGDIMGTTVGAPVYDRTLTPPHFIGIAAVDMTIPFLEEQSGSAYAEVLESLVRRSTAVCPTLHLGTCVLQALRLSTGGLDSVCDAASMGVGDDCMTADNSVRASGGEVYDPPTCMNKATRSPWANTDLLGKEYEERACCTPGVETGCAPPDVGMIAGIAVGGAAFVVIVACCLWCSKGAKKKAGSTAGTGTGSATATPRAVPVTVGEPVQGVPMGSVVA